MPLSLYLYSALYCVFESDRLYSRKVFLPLLVVALGALTYGISKFESNVPIKLLIPALCGALFVCCMVCHGELARQRPHPRRPSRNSIWMISIGGAIGRIIRSAAFAEGI